MLVVQGHNAVLECSMLRNARYQKYGLLKNQRFTDYRSTNGRYLSQADSGSGIMVTWFIEPL